MYGIIIFTVILRDSELYLYAVTASSLRRRGKSRYRNKKYCAATQISMLAFGPSSLLDWLMNLYFSSTKWPSHERGRQKCRFVAMLVLCKRIAKIGYKSGFPWNAVKAINDVENPIIWNVVIEFSEIFPLLVIVCCPASEWCDQDLRLTPGVEMVSLTLLAYQWCWLVWNE